jgi:hypothetical protein
MTASAGEAAIREELDGWAGLRPNPVVQLTMQVTRKQTFL